MICKVEGKGNMLTVLDNLLANGLARSQQELYATCTTLCLNLVASCRTDHRA